MNVKAYIEKFMTERRDFQKYFLERLVDDDGYGLLGGTDPLDKVE